MKNQKKYNVTIGVSYEKEVCIEAENSYDAIRSLKNILLKSDVFSYTPKEIYSLFMNATPTEDSIGKDSSDFNADGLQNGHYDVDLNVDGVSFYGECALEEEFTRVLNIQNGHSICPDCRETLEENIEDDPDDYDDECDEDDCDSCPYKDECEL